MAGETNLLDDLWGEIQVYAYGGAYGEILGDELRHRGLRELLISATITDSVHEPCRIARFTMDNYYAAELSPVHLGTHWAIWGRTMTADGVPTDWREIFLGGTFHDSRAVSGVESTRTYTVYEWAGNSLGRNEGQMTFGTNVYGPQGPTMTQVVQAVCDEMTTPVNLNGIDTGVGIGAMIQSPGMTYWDLIEEAARRTLRRTGRRYFVRANPQATGLEMFEMGNTGVVWKVNDGESGILSNVTLDESAEDLVTDLLGVADAAADNEAGERTPLSATASFVEGEGIPKWRTWLGQIRKVVTPTEEFGLDNPAEVSTTPNKSDHKDDWVAYAVTQGMEEEAADAMTKEQLIDIYLAAPTDQEIITKLQQFVDRELANRARSIIKLHTESLQIPGIRRGDRILLYSPRWGILNVPFAVESVVTTYESGQMLQSMDLVLDARDA